jgi:hypothetical protein
MKKTFFWLIAIVIVAGYFSLCYYLIPKITIYPDKFSSLWYGVVNLVETLILTFIFLYMVIKKGKGSFKGLWKEEEFLVWVGSLIAILVFTFTMMTFSFICIEDLAFDYVTLLAILPCNFLFGMVISYKMYRWWHSFQKMTKSMRSARPPREEKPKPVKGPKEKKSETLIPGNIMGTHGTHYSVSREQQEAANAKMSIYWIGSNNNPIFKALKKQKFGLSSFLDVNQLTPYEFTKDIASRGIVLGCYSNSPKWEKLISICVKECHLAFVMICPLEKRKDAVDLFPGHHKYVVYNKESRVSLSALIKAHYKK